MRKNFPVTNVETKVREDQYLISKTDTKGRITYANPAFVEISGFTREELIGKPHNLIRHPDMPPEAFKDLWDTLHAGKPWLGLVKNRRKDGGFYWVLANAAPIVEQGQVTGYASVRVKPTDEQIEEAEAFYQAINDGDAGGYTVKHGQRVRTGWRRLINVVALPFGPGLQSSLLRMATLALTTTGVATYFALTGGVRAEYQWWMAGGLAAGATAKPDAGSR
jgi:aerotaxis receptor